MSTMVKGRDVILSIYDDTEGAYLPLACLTSNGISQNQEITEGTANKCDLDLPKSLGAYSYEINADGLILSSTDSGYSGKASYDKVEELWLAASAAGETLNWKQSGGNEDKFGEMYISTLEANFDAEGEATFSISGTGVGKIVKVDPKL